MPRFPTTLAMGALHYWVGDQTGSNCFRRGMLMWHLLTSHVRLCCLQGLAGACHALEVQLWSCLQAFANWPTDAAEVYPGVIGVVSVFQLMSLSGCGMHTCTTAKPLCVSYV